VDAQGELDARLTTDGVHLNGAGYLRWRDVLETALK
jgi:lysophospholipase L1-like esterase